MELVYTEYGNIKPKNNHDLPMFRHCFDGLIEVTQKYFDDHHVVLTHHVGEWVLTPSDED